MYIHTIVILLIVGLIAGWAAGMITKGRGLGMLSNLITGVAGAIFSTMLLGHFNITLPGVSGLFINAVIGSIILLIIARIIAIIIKKK